jgi:hypothetical protein
MRRSTLILIGCALALGLLTWYMQKPGNVIQQALATPTTKAPMPLNLLGPQQGPVSRIKVENAAGKQVTLENAGGSWLVTTDHQGPANPDLAENAARTVMSLRLVSQFETAPDPTGSGLDKPAYTISLTLLDGSPYTFQVGSQTVTGSGYYVQTNLGKVVIIEKDKIETLVQMVDAPPFLAAQPAPTP